MKANYLPIQSVFDKHTVFEIPYYQRSYVWDEDNWSRFLENIENLIHVIRGKQVMLDRDLARLYGVETRVLNQAVQRNIERFPGDFMFQFSKEDMEFLRSQIVTLEKVDMRGKHVHRIDKTVVKRSKGRN